jgi:hypothetical protein
MANIYVRSTDGSNADDGSTWALAKATLAGAQAIAVAGDTVYVSQAHAETDTSNLALLWAGTLANPIRILCVNDAAEPPTVLATSASLTRTGGAQIGFHGSIYVYGLRVVSSANINLNNSDAVGRDAMVFDSCLLRSGSNFVASANATDSAEVWLKNCQLRYPGAGNYFQAGGRIRISGGSIETGGITPTNMFYAGTSGRGGVVEIEGFDFSNFTSGFSFFQGANFTVPGRMVVRNCKLPASWSGSLITGTITGYGARAEMHNCDSGDTNYRFRAQDYSGQIDSETTIYRTGGATDGTTPISWRMASNANTVFPAVLLESPELPAVWNTSVGSSKTATVEIVQDGASALTDGEVWLEVQYLSASGFPLSSFVSDRKGLLAAGTAQATSAAAWTGDTGTGPNGSTTWNTLKLECTFTPQEAGYIQARVYLAKPSTTVFVDPKITVV